MWVARDKDGELAIYNGKPVKNIEGGIWVPPCITDEFIDLGDTGNWFCPDVKWEDEEPTEMFIDDTRTFR